MEFSCSQKELIVFRLVRHIIGLIAALLFSALGAAAMPLPPTVALQAEFFPQQKTATTEHTNVHFAARGPPKAASKVAFTSATVALHGNGVVMYVHETHVAILVSGVGLDATNKGLDGFYEPQAWRQNNEDCYSGNVTSTTLPPYSAKNVHMAGKRHPETDIVYDQRGFPIFADVARYDTRFPADQFGVTDYQGQMRMGTRDLRTTIQTNPQLRSQFEPDQLQAIQSGRANIPRLTWHHHQDSGRMQLVPRDVHADTGHIGGASMLAGQ